MYAPQLPVSLDDLMSEEVQKWFFGKAESMMAMENRRTEQLFGTVANPSETFTKTMEKLMGDKELRPVQESRSKAEDEVPGGMAVEQRGQDYFDNLERYVPAIGIRTFRHEINVPVKDGRVDKAELLKTVRGNSLVKPVQTNGSTRYIAECPNLGMNVEISADGLTHGFGRSAGNNSENANRLNAKAALLAPNLLQNAVEVNRYTGDATTDHPYRHVMMAAFGEKTPNGVEYYAVRLMVEQRSRQDAVLKAVDVCGKLYAVNAKRTDLTGLKGSKASRTTALFNYSMRNFINEVKLQFDDTFAEGVYASRGDERGGDPKFTKNLQFSVSPAQDAEYREALDAGDVDWQKMLVAQAAYNAGYIKGGYHGTNVKDITVFNTKATDTKRTTFQLLFGTHITLNKAFAELYTHKAAGSKGTGNVKASRQGRIYDLYFKADHPLELYHPSVAYEGEELYRLYPDFPDNVRKWVQKNNPMLIGSNTKELAAATGMREGKYISSAAV